MTAEEGSGTRWERLEADPCPNCKCCSARLCMRAVIDGKLCGQIAPPEDYRIIARCPCGVRSS